MNRQSHVNIGSWKVTVLRSIEDIKAVRPIWEQMQRNEPFAVPHADIDRYFSVLKACGDDAQPHIILIKQNSHPTTMVIGRVEKHPVKLKLGYKTLFKPKLRCLTVVYGGVLGQPTNEACAVLIRKLMNTLSRGEVDVVQFNHLRVDSPIYQFARKTPSVLSRGYFPKIDPHWKIVIPENMDEFLEACSKNRRRHLKRYIRKIEDQYPGRVKIVTYTSEDELDEAIKAASHISAKTYQYALGEGFVDNFRTRTLLTVAARKNWLRLDILYIDDEPCAFRRALKYGNTCFGQQSSYSPAWKEYNIGTILFLRVLESLCRDPAIDFFDFGIGAGEHKRWGNNQPWAETSVYIFAPRLYPVLINILQSSMMGLSLVLECILNKIGLTGWVKRRWRNLLQKRNTK